MISRPAPLALTVLALLAAGCASSPEVMQTGRLTSGGYALAEGQREDAAALVGPSLEAAGFRPVPAASADYIVHVGVARASAKVGAYRPSPEAPTAMSEDWLVKPGGGPGFGRGYRERVSVQLIDAKTGRPAFSGSASLKGGKDTSPQRTAQLAAAAIAPPAR